MLKKIKKIITFLTTLLSPLFLTIACNIKNTGIFNYQNQISLVSNMPETWPQYQALKKIVNDYNENKKNENNFMKVVFLSKKNVKTKHLNTRINKLILSHSNDVPNLLLDGDFGQVYQLATFNRLLNLESKTLNSSHFISYFVNDLSSLAITNYSKKGLYATPIFALNNNSLVINKPVLKKIFMLMVKKGAIIEKTNANAIIKEIVENKTSLSNNENLLVGNYGSKRQVKRPILLWVDNERLNSTSLANYKINDKIFQTYEKLYDFLAKAHHFLKLKSPLYVYGSGVLSNFLTLLDSQQLSLTEQHSLFNKNANSKYNFPFLKNDQAKQKIITAFNHFIKPAKEGYGDYPENYNVVGIRNGQHAIASHFSVSARYSYRSQVFGEYTNNGFGFHDILYLPSPAKWNQQSKIESRQLSRWFLMGIKTNSKKDQAVKLFVNYLYNGTLKDDIANFKNKPRKVANFLQWESSYGIPLIKSLNFKEQYESLYSKLQDDNHKYDAIYRGLKNFKDSMANRDALRNFDGNQYTSKLLNIIERIINIALKNPKQWNGERFVVEILKNKSDFNY